MTLGYWPWPMGYRNGWSRKNAALLHFTNQGLPRNASTSPSLLSLSPPPNDNHWFPVLGSRLAPPSFCFPRTNCPSSREWFLFKYSQRDNKGISPSQGRPQHVRKLRCSVGSVSPNEQLDRWRKFLASREFLNFENRTIIKRDMAQNVSKDTFQSQIPRNFLGEDPQPPSDNSIIYHSTDCHYTLAVTWGYFLSES